MTVPPAGANSRIPTINGLRGLAIAAVLWDHIIYGRLAPSDLNVTILGKALPLTAFVTNGWTGVNLFFILSGFVLFLPYTADGGRLARVDGRLAFYRRRALRLLPLFYIAVLTEWALYVARGMPAHPGELASVLSLGFIFDARTFGPHFNVALWSIGDEIAFSALFPFLVLALRRIGPARFLGLMLILALTARFFGLLFYPFPQGATFNSDAFLCRIDEFALGMLIALWYREDRLPRRVGLYALIGSLLVLIAWFGFDLVARHALPALTRAGLNDVLDAGLAAIVIAALGSRGRLAATLSWPPLQLAGMMCYSIYIWHLPLLMWLAPDRTSMPRAEFLMVIPVFLITTFAIAAVSYRFIEFRRVGNWRALFLLPQPVLREA